MALALAPAPTAAGAGSLRHWPWLPWQLRHWQPSLTAATTAATAATTAAAAVATARYREKGCRLQRTCSVLDSPGVSLMTSGKAMLKNLLSGSFGLSLMNCLSLMNSRNLSLNLSLSLQSLNLMN